MYDLRKVCEDPAIARRDRGGAASAGGLMMVHRLAGGRRYGDPLRDAFFGTAVREVPMGRTDVTVFPLRRFDTQDLEDRVAEIGAAIFTDRANRNREPFELAVTQLMLNACSHSGAKGGVVGAIRSDYFASLAVMDDGRGIAASFQHVFDSCNGKDTCAGLRGTHPDVAAIDWARREHVTSARGAQRENAGRGLPLLIAAATASCIASGQGLFYRQQLKGMFPDYYRPLVKGRQSSETLMQFGQGIQGVVIEAFFNLRHVDTNIGSRVPPKPDAVHQALSRRYCPEIADSLMGGPQA